MSFWINFFKEAGIPAGEATNYAVIFTDNRIQPSMLLDLSKEYLSDMGITMMGDIIAILKQAKTAHTQSMRARALEGALSNSRPATPTKRSTPASRTVAHYLDRTPECHQAPAESSPVVMVSEDMASRLGPVPAGSNTKIRLKSRASEEVPVPKSRRVFPEHEGKYKVTMPKGTTVKTKKILEMQQKKNGSKGGSVFNRLSQKTQLDSLAQTSEAETSVFSRLGKATKRPASTGMFSRDGEIVGCGPVSPQEPLEYAGILKASPAKKRKITSPNFTVTLGQRLGPEPSTSQALNSAGILGSLFPMAENKSVRDRLGGIVKAPATSSTGAGVSKQPQITRTINLGVKKNISTKTNSAGTVTIRNKMLKNRLGPEKTEVSSTSDVPRVRPVNKPQQRGRINKAQLQGALSKAQLQRAVSKAQFQVGVKKAQLPGVTKPQGVFSRLGKQVTGGL